MRVQLYLDLVPPADTTFAGVGSWFQTDEQQQQQQQQQVYTPGLIFSEASSESGRSHHTQLLHQEQQLHALPNTETPAILQATPRTNITRGEVTKCDIMRRYCCDIVAEAAGNFAEAAGGFG